jgi:hypothetical protein
LYTLALALAIWIEEKAHQTMEALTELEQMADEQDRSFTFTL